DCCPALTSTEEPRPRCRHLWCQPGFTGCLAACFAFIWAFAGRGVRVAMLFKASVGPLTVGFWHELSPYLRGLLIGPAYEPPHTPDLILQASQSPGGTPPGQQMAQGRPFVTIALRGFQAV